MRPKIDELRLVPAGTKVWSIALQEAVRFDKDMIVRVTNTLCSDDKGFFGTLQLVLFNFPGSIPGIMDKANGDVGPITMSETKPWELPPPQLMTYTYE